MRRQVHLLPLTQTRQGDEAIATFPIAIRNMHMKIQNAKLIASLGHDTSITLTHEREHRTYAATAGDERTLRGIPAIGRGVAGVSPGTRPDAITTRD